MIYVWNISIVPVSSITSEKRQGTKKKIMEWKVKIIMKRNENVKLIDWRISTKSMKRQNRTVALLGKQKNEIAQERVELDPRPWEITYVVQLIAKRQHRNN